MKKILVPCDFSFTSNQALSFALQLAKRLSAEIIVFTALGSQFTFGSARRAFEELRKKFGSLDNLTFSTMQGSVTESIRSQIDTQNIDLVVMGTNGAAGIKEYTVGSNTEKVVRFSPVPVIAIRKNVSISSIHNIVIPTDTETISQGFLWSLIELQELLNARLHLLLISTEHRLFNSKDLMKKLKDFVALAGLENYTLNLQREDRKEDAIVSFAREVNADMIAMATHGRHGISHLFMGSLAEDVVNHVSFPVWTYSIRGAAPVVNFP